MFNTQDMTNEGSMPEEIESLINESKNDNSDLLELPLLSPSDFELPQTETIEEGTVKTAMSKPSTPSSYLNATPLPVGKPHPTLIKHCHPQKAKKLFHPPRITTNTTEKRRGCK